MRAICWYKEIPIGIVLYIDIQANSKSSIEIVIKFSFSLRMDTQNARTGKKETSYL